MIGRARDADICLPSPALSRRHAEITVGSQNHTLRDLGSTNGTVCDGEKVVDTIVLRHGNRIVLGGVVVLVFSIEDAIERRMRAKLYELATRDPLTNTYNRRYFSERLESEWPWAVRHTRSCALLALDLDHFKKINDTWGHPAGDLVLEEFAKLVLATIRREDVFARVGGEEFFVLCRGTELEQAAALAERLRANVERHKFVWEGNRIPVTVSIGVAASREGGIDTPEALQDVADHRLYDAKAAGRNRVAAALASIDGPAGR